MQVERLFDVSLPSGKCLAGQSCDQIEAYVVETRRCADLQKF